MEGPESREYLKTLDKVDLARDEMRKAGLLKDDPLKSIDAHIKKLYEKADGIGLIVQPRNGR